MFTGVVRDDAPGDVAPLSDVPLLKVDALTKVYGQRRMMIRSGAAAASAAAESVSFTLAQGQTLGIVGESGSGKSTVARCIAGVVPLTSGEVVLRGERVDFARRRLPLGERRKIQMVFQDPTSSLNPRIRVRDAVAGPIRLHFPELDRGGVTDRATQLLTQVGFDAEMGSRFPHELSGGQRQRVAIARTLAIEPDVIICDEPVSALDVTVQAQVLNLLLDQQEQRRFGMILISHDLSVIRHMADDVAVMYRGRVVEHGRNTDVFSNPLHPYTELLLRSVPSPVTGAIASRPAAPRGAGAASGAGCAFLPRCPIGSPSCGEHVPALEKNGHFVACFERSVR